MSIRDIVNEYDDLHFVKINKQDKRDKSSWTFDVIDENSKISGVSDLLSNYKYQIVTLRRDNHFFLAYKIYDGDDFEYFVDCKKSMHKDNPAKYVRGLVDYSLYSNDISTVKNASSFKITSKEMKMNHIDNFLDMCYHFGEYSAIGTGYTRNLRNLIVLDIDVDCTIKDNEESINNLLIEFGKCNSMPDFFIFNNESKHVQLQWLIKSLSYKEENKEMIENTINEISNDSEKSKEMKLFGTDFSKLTQIGLDYRKFTIALTELNDKEKFGDKNYTFWKAKNFYSALLGLYDLELRMPYFEDDTVKYHTKEDMFSFFDTKDSRRDYYNEAPYADELYRKTKHLVEPIIRKMSEKNIEEIKDDEKIIIDNNGEKVYGESRNNFVFKCTRESTWEIARKCGYKSLNDIKELSSSKFSYFKSKVKKLVKSRFEIEDDKYNGTWPGTTNISAYTNDEFNSTFNHSFHFAIQNIKIKGYDDCQRQTSIESRHLKKEIKFVLVDYVYRNFNLKRDEMFDRVNKILNEACQENMSMTTFKVYLSELRKLNEAERIEKYKFVVSGIEERTSQFNDAVENGNQKSINTCKKRLNYISFNENAINDLKKKFINIYGGL